MLGVQFNSLEHFLSPHLGMIWDVFKDDFPVVEEHPYIPPMFETFGNSAPFVVPNVNFQLVARPEMSRVNFINRDRRQVLQVQRDGFIHNWRKNGEGADYPRFERMIETFERGFEKFIAIIDREKLGQLFRTNARYHTNQIPVPPGETAWETFALTFPDRAGNSAVRDLGQPEDIRFAMRYVIPASDGPLGRVTVVAQPARRADGVNIIQFVLAARGRPLTPDVGSVLDFLANGRVDLNRVFETITSPTMQERWGRKQ